MGEKGLHVDGFFVPSSRNLVYFDQPHDRAEAFNTARHECTHLLLEIGFEGAIVPVWLNEGLACYPAADGEAAEGMYTTSLLLHTNELLRTGKAPTLLELMDVDGEDFRFLHYAMSWSWIHFLNTEPHRARFQRFLVELRRELREMSGEPSEGAAPTAATYREAAQTVLEDSFGSFFSPLQREWREFFETEFALRTTTQVLEYAWASIEGARGQALQRERDRAIDEAFFVLDRLPSDGEERTLEQAALARAACLSLRLVDVGSDLAAQRLALRAVIRSLREVPDGTNDARRGEIALRALYSLRGAMGEGRTSFLPIEFRAELLESVPKTTASQHDLGEARVVLFDELLEMAQSSLAAAMVADPLNRRATHQLLFLAMDFSPSTVESIFDRLRLLVEYDPDDTNLAALGVAYAALGNTGWAEHLLQEAQARTADSSQLAVYEQYIPH